MANVRCTGEHSDHLVRHARRRIYVARVEPINYPRTAVICGIEGCIKPGLVHLDKEEWLEYHRGERIFGLFETNAVKFEVKENAELISQSK